MPWIFVIFQIFPQIIRILQQINNSLTLSQLSYQSQPQSNLQKQTSLSRKKNHRIIKICLRFSASIPLILKKDPSQYQLVMFLLFSIGKRVRYFPPNRGRLRKSSRGCGSSLIWKKIRPHISTSDRYRVPKISRKMGLR